MNGRTAEYINTLGKFCGKRDVKLLDCGSLYQKYGIERADVMVLFGGSILAGGDVLADAIRNRIASTYIIVGGAGHTTERRAGRGDQEQDCVNLYHSLRRRPHDRDSSEDRACRISVDQDSRSDRS